MNPFEQHLENLSRILGIPLHAEKGYICKLLIHGSLRVQLEHEPSEGRILIASFPCEIPPGKLRENILKEGLKANNSLERLGIFAYSEKTNSLAYFTYISDGAPSDQLADALLQFIEIARTWKSAVETGDMHLIKQAGSQSPSPFTF